MRRCSTFLLTVLFLILVGSFAFAQQTDVAISGFGVLTKTSTGKGLEETATKSGGGMFSFRHFPYKHNGVEVNYSYTGNTQHLTDLSSGSLHEVETNIHEVTGAYVFHATRGAVQPFALAGGGFLLFHPTDHAIARVYPTVRNQNKPAFLFGAGADISLNKSVAVRAQYRGFVYKAPDFFGDNLALHTGTAMIMSEPSIGLVYRF